MVVVASTRDLAIVAELGTSSEIFDAKFAPDGSVVTAEQDGGKRWSVAPQRELARLPSSVTLAWLDDATLMADASVIDLATGAVRTLARDRLVQCNAAIDTGHAITGGYDRQLDLWDLSRGSTPIVSLEAAAAVSRIAVDPTHRRAVSVSAGTVELWDVTALPAPTALANVAGEIQQIVASPSGQLAVRAHETARDVTTLFGPAHEVIAQLEGWPLAFRPGADELVSDREGHLLVTSARDGHLLREVAETQPIYHLAFDRAGRRAVTATPDRVEVRDATTWHVISSFDAAPDITALALDDAGHIITGHDDGAVRLWDERSGAALGVLVGHRLARRQQPRRSRRDARVGQLGRHDAALGVAIGRAARHRPQLAPTPNAGRDLAERRMDRRDRWQPGAVDPRFSARPRDRPHSGGRRARDRAVRRRRSRHRRNRARPRRDPRDDAVTVRRA